jgi:hypothetical protein
MSAKKPPAKTMAEIAWVPLAVALIGVVGSLGVAWITASHTAAKEVAPIQAASIGPQSSGQKLCSAVVPGGFRDSMIVPHTWKIDTCKQFQTSIGAFKFQIACVFDDKISWGNMDGSIPDQNCGW